MKRVALKRRSCQKSLYFDIVRFHSFVFNLAISCFCQHEIEPALVYDGFS